MTFGRPRYNNNYDIELLRMCSKPGYRIIGGASKLFKYATHSWELSDIISYCDLSKFDGEVYTQLGMKFSYNSPPQEIWSKDQKKITANLLRQRGYDQLFNTTYGKGTSNEQLMVEHGWLPVYDCGQAVYAYGHIEITNNEQLHATSTISDYELISAAKHDKNKVKICAFCGKEFIPNSSFQKYCKGPHYRICPICGKEYLEDNSENLKRPPVACSYKCRAEKTKRTSLQRYGITAPGNTSEARKKAEDTRKLNHTAKQKKI